MKDRDMIEVQGNYQKNLILQSVTIVVFNLFY